MSDRNTDWRLRGDIPDLDLMLDLSEMTEDEQRALSERLKAVVPRRTYGDGVEAFEEYLMPQHAQTEEMFEAAQKLSLVRGVLGETVPRRANEDTTHVSDAAQIAVDTLAELGITYDGVEATYVFWSHNRGRYVQQNANPRQALMQRAERAIGYRFLMGRYENSFERNVDLPDHQNPQVTSEQRAKADAWQLAYPWRSSRSLKMLSRTEQLEPNSRVWHAARILSLNAQIEQSLSYVAKISADEPLKNEDVIGHMREVAELSLLMGRSAEALAKKPLEYDVVERTEATERRAKAGGRKSASQRAMRVEAFMLEIESLAQYFPAISEARLIDQAFDSVIARDPDLWRQGKGQKEVYLSQDIRSVEPYKSRYYAAFSQTA